MLKKISHKLALAILLILTVAVLAVATSVLVFANTTATADETRTLTVNFNPSHCHVNYYLNGGNEISLQNGVSVQIPYGQENVKIEVVPTNGYEWTTIEGNLTIQKGQNSGTFNLFTQNETINITCGPKTFKVILLPEEGESEVLYTFDDPSKYVDRSYVKGGEAIVMDSAKKGSGGYTFQHWEYVYDYYVAEDGKYYATQTERLTKNSNDEWWIPSDLNIQNKWQQTGDIYLRPCLKANPYPVQFEDYVLKPSGPYLMTDVYSVEIPMGTKIPNNNNEKLIDTGAVLSYVGYDFSDLENRTDLFKELIVTTDLQLNVLKRYFVPIEYAIEYDYNFGELASSESTPLKHIFDEATALPKAQRLGFTFGGWEVLVNDSVVETINDLNNLQLSAKNALYATGNTEEKITLRAIWMLNIEDYKIDYPNETFLFPAGKYLITLGEARMEFTIGADGICSEKIPEGFFGQTVDLTFLGQATGDANYQGKLAIQARPAAPTASMFGDFSATSDTVILVNVADGVDASLLEFALAIKGEPEKMRDWQSSPKFEGLYQGTVYTVYIRVKATDTAPCGKTSEFETKTGIGLYIKGLIADLTALTAEDEGEVIAELLQETIAQLNELESLGSSATFYADVEQIVTNFKSSLRFARQKDQKIASLRNYRDALLQTGAYNAENSTKLETICADAVTLIKNASEDDNLQLICDDATKRMAEVKISYLKDIDGNMQITAFLGMHKDSKLILVRFPDFTSQSDRVYAAIDAGKVFGNSGTTTQELIQLLKSQDVIAAYRMQLDEVGTAISDPAKSFECRLLLSQELRELSGVRVAYYDHATGRLEVLDSRIEGEYLIFSAGRITDFVILGDPSLNLTVPIIALSVILLCQVIGIAILLVCRYRSKNALRHYSIALPVMLTVQTLPKNGSTIVLILGILVVLLQIVLMALLLNSEIIHRSRLQRSKHQVDDSSIPTMATADPMLYEDEAAPAEGDEQQPEEMIGYTAYYAQEDNLTDQAAWQGDPELYEDDPYATPFEEELSEDALQEDVYAENGDQVYYAYEPTAMEGEQPVYAEYDADAQSVDNVFYGEGNGTYAEELYNEAEPQPEDSEDAVFIEAPLYSYDDSVDAVYGEQPEESSETFYFPDPEVDQIAEQETLEEEEDPNKQTEETL